MTRKILLLPAALALVGHSAFAQVTTGTISGTVRDATHAVLPGATVNLKHVTTGEVRSATTDEQGRYRAPNLGLGDYELSATLPGFQTKVRTGVSLTIAREAIVDFTMEVGDISESIAVSGEASLVNTTSASVGGLIDEESIKTLPLSGRDFVQLALLEPSVMRVSNTENSISKGFGTRTSFAGSRPRQNIFLMDGTNVNNFTNFAVPGSVAGVILGVDTVREFQVLVGSYGAEYAGAGGTLSAVTKSGTNQLHGTGFWFLRNDAMDAQNYFDVEKPDFSRNQYGGTLGGPILRDKLFFFGSYEGLRDRLGLTRISSVPDENARRGLVPNATGQLVNVGVHPNIRPYLDLNPLPNGRVFGDGFAEHIWSGTEPTDQAYVVAKGDYRYGVANSIFVRYTLDDSDTTKLTELPLWRSLWTNTSQWMTAENRTVVSERTFIVARLGWVNSDVFGDDVVADGQSFDESLALIPGKPFGTVTYVPSRNSSSPRINKGNSFQYTGQMMLERGDHSIKFGGDVTQHFLEFVGVSHIYGNYFFNSLSNFLQNRPNRLQLREGSDPRPERDVKMTVGGFYVQDDFRISPRFTFNAGLRYEPYTVPVETNGLESTLKNALDPAYTVGSKVMRNPSKNNFGPRFGFAWDVMGDGKLSIRGGAGLYHDVLLPMIYRNTYSGSPPYSSVLNVDNPTNFPNVLADASLPGRPVLTNPDGFAYDATQPRIYQYNAQADWQLTSTLVVSAGYVGSRGHNQVRIMDGNTAIATTLPDGTKFFPTTSVRRNPEFAGSWWRVTDGQSFYDGLRAKVNKRLSDGMTFGASYSLGHAIDDSSTDVGQTDFQSNASLPQDPDDRLSHRGASNFDIRHNFSANFSVMFPSQSLDGVAKALLGNWQVNGIVSLASGQPFSPTIGFDNARNRSRAFSQHPDLVPGFSSNPVLGGTETYFDPAAFSLPAPGTYGNLGRNTLRAPGLALVDASLIKQIVAGSQRYELRIEAFNILNRANFGLPNSVIFDAGGRVGSAGRITTTNTAARQVQLGFKVIF